MAPKKPDLSVAQILNMSVGFFGIQHGFEIQFARMSSIYEKLGAKPDQIPLLWLAAPMTGLLIQPIIGYMSDKTWLPGLRMRRRPYFFAGSLFASLALVLLPDSSSLWMAAGLLWVLDASLNVSMEPFRAFVADKQNTRQRPTGYAFQSVMIGLGTIAGNYIASIDLNEKLPWLSGFGKDAVHLAFYACAAIFFFSVLYTVVTTPEDPPEDMKEFRAASSENALSALKKWASETRACYFGMPPVMKRLALIQFFTWMGLFCMWMYYSVAVAHQVFGANDPHSALYDQGIRWAAHTTMVKGLATPLFALCIPFIVARIGRAYTHALALLLCGLGLCSLPFIKTPGALYLPMIAAGIGWASIVAMPYVILVEHLPKGQYGIFMGMFNMFIVIPEIIVALGLGGFLTKLLHNNHAYIVGFGGALILIAAALTPSLQRFEPKPEPLPAGDLPPALSLP